MNAVQPRHISCKDFLIDFETEADKLELQTEPQTMCDQMNFPKNPANERKSATSVSSGSQANFDNSHNPAQATGVGSKRNFSGNQGQQYQDRRSQQKPRRERLSYKLDKEVVDLLSNELLNMSVRDRNAINEEIHGVCSLAVDETPRIIANALQSFRIELELLSAAKKTAYTLIQAFRQRQRQLQLEQRQQQHATLSGAYNGITNATRQHCQTTSTPAKMYAAYADSDDFRLRFLRSCLFDVRRAVRRFANYLNFIQDFWGDSYLARPIQLSDLTTSEMKILKKGWIQLLPFRDRRGRRINQFY